MGWLAVLSTCAAMSSPCGPCGSRTRAGMNECKLPHWHYHISLQPRTARLKILLLTASCTACRSFNAWLPRKHAATPRYTKTAACTLSQALDQDIIAQLPSSFDVLQANCSTGSCDAVGGVRDHRQHAGLQHVPVGQASPAPAAPAGRGGWAGGQAGV